MALPCPVQRGLFDGAEPGFDPAMTGLVHEDLGDGAWLEIVRGWVSGHDALLEALWATTRWQQHRRRMYDRMVDVPRLFATLPDDGPGHPLLGDLAAALGTRYRRGLDRISLAAYRDGRDSVAFHGDRLGRAVDDAIVAIVSLGSPRRFLLRPAGGGPSLALRPGRGDLVVMGGTCQRTWEHAVPKAAGAGFRISVQFRSAEAEGEV